MLSWKRWTQKPSAASREANSLSNCVPADLLLIFICFYLLSCHGLTFFQDKLTKI
nr:MAG TPA: hypothetical protein [Caudoviricetes sp.]